MRLVVSAKRLYEDGSTDDASYRELVLDEQCDHRKVGEFLIDYAAVSIDTTDDDGVRCDAVDVTISKAPPKGQS